MYNLTIPFFGRQGFWLFISEIGTPKTPPPCRARIHGVLSKNRLPKSSYFNWLTFSKTANLWFASISRKQPYSKKAVAPEKAQIFSYISQVAERAGSGCPACEPNKRKEPNIKVFLICHQFQRTKWRYLESNNWPTYYIYYKWYCWWFRNPAFTSWGW